VTVIPRDYEQRVFRHDTSRGAIARRVYRRAGAGPTVILLHELPRISDRALAIADTLAGRDHTVVLPRLMPDLARVPAAVRAPLGMLALCVMREMAALATNATGSIVEWLRALARDESARNGDRPVGVIGMCFSGGFALGAILDPAVGAAVLSQPSLPFPLTASRRRDLGVSDADLATIKARVGDGGNLRVMRYALDWMSPVERHDRTVAEFPGCQRRTIPTTSRSDHSVLADAVAGAGSPDLDAALAETLDFLATHLSR